MTQILRYQRSRDPTINNQHESSGQYFNNCIIIIIIITTTTRLNTIPLFYHWKHMQLFNRISYAIMDLGLYVQLLREIMDLSHTFVDLHVHLFSQRWTYMFHLSQDLCSFSKWENLTYMLNFLMRNGLTCSTCKWEITGFLLRKHWLHVQVINNVTNHGNVESLLWLIY